MRNDIIGSKEILINIINISTLIASYIVIIFIHARQRDHFIQRKVLLAITTTLPLYNKALVPIHYHSLPDNQDFFFQPNTYLIFNIYAHLLD